MSILHAIANLPTPVLNHWGYWIICAGALLEATPLAGLLVPGQIIVVFGGFFAKTGALDIGDTLFFAAFGAVLGDLLGYGIGRRYGTAFLEHYGKYFFFKKSALDKTKQIMRGHTGKTIIFGRFNSLTRAFAPFVAGSSDVPFWRFLVYNIAGGVTWAAMFVLIGYIFGASYEVAAQYAGRIMMGAAVASIVLIYTYRFVNTRRHTFAKYHLFVLAGCLAALSLFAKMLEDVWDMETIVRLDAWVAAHTPAIWHPGLTHFFMFFTTLGGPVAMTLIACLVFIVLILRNKWYPALLLASSMVSGLVIYILIKLIVHRARPLDGIIVEHGYSFPSGHSTMSAIFFSVLMILASREVKTRWMRSTGYILCILTSVLIGLSRIYLRVHWTSDVIGGFSLGIFLVTAWVLVFQGAKGVGRWIWKQAQDLIS